MISPNVLQRIGSAQRLETSAGQGSLRGASESVVGGHQYLDQATVCRHSCLKREITPTSF